jgi:hypothetical protein
MKIRHSILALVACVVTLGLVGSAAAAERNYWKHSKGHFENTTGNTWVEKIDNRTHKFVEKERTERYIELYDSSRNCWVRLFNDRCLVKFPDKGDTKFEEYYQGRWGR